MDVFEPWALATLLFLILLGSGRTLRGRWLGRMAFGGGLVVSVAVGLALFSLLWMGLGHFGAVRRPWPMALMGFGLLLALPGLFWTLRDWRQPAPGLERGFGPRWFAGGAWFLLLAALLLSVVWITGAFGWEGRYFLFERTAMDYGLGRIFFDPALPRDPFLGNDLLELWLFGFGAPEASLALAWWLGVAVLFGVCGLGWRLHAHGAGLAAAAILAIVLFAADRPLFLSPALPATVALLAVMVLAVESRGRPHVGRTLVAGGLGGFALISDLGAATMLLPLLFFGPLWCKKAGGLRVDSGDARVGEDPDLHERVAELGVTSEEEAPEAYDDYADEGLVVKDEEGGKKWVVPTRHLGYGLLGLSLPLAPWVARNLDWTGEPLYGLDPAYRIERSYLRDFDATPRLGEITLDYRIQVDYAYQDYHPDFGTDLLDGVDLFGDYLTATEWGAGILLVSLFAPLYGWRRREPLYYVVPGVIGYGLGACFGDFELTHPASLGLLSVTAGSALYTWRGCSPPGRTLALGGTLATGGLAIGLSGAYDCGYWDDFDEPESWTPRVTLAYDYGLGEQAGSEPGGEEEPEPGAYRLRHDEGLGLKVEYHFFKEDEEDEEAGEGWQVGVGYRPGGIALPDREEGEEPGWGLGLRYDIRDLDLQLRYRYLEDKDSLGVERIEVLRGPQAPQYGPGATAPGYNIPSEAGPGEPGETPPQERKPFTSKIQPRLPDYVQPGEEEQPEAPTKEEARKKSERTKPPLPTFTPKVQPETNVPKGAYPIPGQQPQPNPTPQQTPVQPSYPIPKKF